MDQGPHQQALHLMQEQVEHVVRLVDDLLDVSRIVQGKIELRRSCCNLLELVNRSVDAVQAQFSNREQTFQMLVPDEEIWVDADPIRIVQVIENLLNNASKYTDPHGTIELDIVRDAALVTLRVRDTGIGIDASLLPDVFELFTQSTRALDRSQGGLGIGLTLVKRLVEMHGGSVKGDSDGLGKGSTFTVTLPVVHSKPNHPQQGSAPLTSNNYRIAIVDDNRAAAFMLQMLLRKLGKHIVETASDGPSFLSWVSVFSPDVVFLDIGLPGMDGYEIARELRKRDDLQTTLLVALTGYGQEEDRRKSRDAGFDLHLVKPPAIDQLLDALSHQKLTKSTS